MSRQEAFTKFDVDEEDEKGILLDGHSLRRKPDDNVSASSEVDSSSMRQTAITFDAVDEEDSLLDGHSLRKKAITEGTQEIDNTVSAAKVVHSSSFRRTAIAGYVDNMLEAQIAGNKPDDADSVSDAASEVDASSMW